MNSRERVQKTINFEEPDRVPIDLGAMRASGINAVVYSKLKQRIGINTPTKIFDCMQILAEVELEVLNHFHVDIIALEGATAGWAQQSAGQGIEKQFYWGQKSIFPTGYRYNRGKRRKLG